MAGLNSRWRATSGSRRLARLGFEARLGNTPAWGGVPRLAKLVGAGSMRDILLTGDPISAEQAERLGIVQRLCEPEELDDWLNALIDSLLACDTATQGLIKAMFGNPDMLAAAQEAALAGFTATRKKRAHAPFLQVAERPDLRRCQILSIYKALTRVSWRHG